MRERMTTALDTAGLLLVAAGAGAATYRWVGWAALAVSGSGWPSSQSARSRL